MADAREWWTVRQLAAHYEMSLRTIYAEISSGRLAAHRFGGARGALRICDADRLEWEVRCRRGSPPASSFRVRHSSASLVEKHLQN